MSTPNPEIGTVITLTTRYSNEYMFADSQYNDTTYENVTVLSPEPWMKSDQIKISSCTDRMPFRVIAMKNIHSIDNTVIESFVSSIREILVQGSKDNQYTVVVDNSIAISCTCPGYTFRGKCKHLTAAELEVA